MKRLRRLEDLIDRLSDSSQRRRRELITLGRHIADPRVHDATLAGRTAIVLAYAHWEGFVKDAAQAYVAYVDEAGVPLRELIVNFQALACKGHLASAALATKRIGLHIDVAGLFIDQNAQILPMDAAKVIDTESNLTWEVFSNICLSLGIDYESRWITYRYFIDDLFQSRCEIAHGSIAVPKPEYAREVTERVGEFVGWFTTDIENAASRESFRRSRSLIGVQP